MPRLPVVGVVKYGDFTFPSPLKLTVQVVPVYDDADRVVKYRTYNIRLDVILVSEDFDNSGSYQDVGSGVILDASSNMLVLRRQLTTPALALEITNQGLGSDLSFTQANVANYGPKPRVLLWEPIGSSRAVHIVWECEVSAIECGTAAIGQHNQSDFGAFTYSVSFGLSEDGLSTRTISGVYEVNPRRTGSGLTTIRTADTFRQRLGHNLPTLLNFQRTQVYNLSEDRRSITFSITDTEEPSENPLHPHVVKARLTHRLSSISIWGKWRVNFSGEILVAPGRDRRIAWNAFVAAIRPRIDSWRKAKATRDPGGSPSDPEIKPYLFPMSFDIEEEIFGGRSMSFSLTYHGVTSLASLIEASGLWLPVPGTWDRWRGSMDGPRGPHTLRGFSQLNFPDSADRIHNFCIGVGNDNPSQSATPVRTGSSPPDIEEALDAVIPAANSWYQYTIRLTIVKDNQTIFSRRIGNSDATREITIDGTGKDIQFGKKAAKKDGEEEPKKDDTHLQERGVSAYFLRLNGTARRYGHPITSKDLAVVKTIDGKPAIQGNGPLGGDWGKANYTSAVTVDRAFSCPRPMYVQRWARTYFLEGPEATIKLDEYPQDF